VRCSSVVAVPTFAAFSLLFTGCSNGLPAPQAPLGAGALGEGQPVSGGFNYHDRKLAQVDDWGWVDVGIVSGNAGTAYVPSQK
jgi:hypothetical protein